MKLGELKKQLPVFCKHIPMCLLKINLYPFDGDFFLCMQSGRLLSFQDRLLVLLALPY